MPTDQFSPLDHVNAQSLGAKFCPEFENSHCQTPLMQSQMPQSWTSTPFDGYNSDYSVQNHFPTVMMPDSLQNYPLYMPHTDLLSDRSMDYTPSLPDNSSAPPPMNIDLQSSVMNEASKYVSSSLRVLHSLNGDQPCEMSQGSSGEVLGGFIEAGQNNPHPVVPPDVNNAHSVPGQNFNPYFLSYQAESCPSSSHPPVSQKSDKELITVDETHPVFLSEITNTTPLLLPVKEEPETFSVSSVCATPGHTETSQEMSPVPTEDTSLEETTGADECKKFKKIKSSKRTKWPAIIKDGKVICCRCYREFSSTKSLGGHLSKRSQCRPIDEVDLTADLPTSFLDFLNDPDISTMHSSLVTPESDGHSTFTDMHDPNYSIQNGDLASADTYKMTFIAPQSGCSLANFSTDLTAETGPERNSSVEFLSTPSGDDGNILEIERALRRLDLVDVLNQDAFKVGTTALQDMLKVETATFHNLMPATKIADTPSSRIKRNGDGERKNFLKPFRCSEVACIYGAMTKEALFKHLSRIHDFSDEQINELKKNPDRLSPYTCHLCTKTFTRTTGLKIHYKNVHHLSREDVSRLKIGRDRKKKEGTELNHVNNCLVSNRIPSFLPVQPPSVFTVAATNARREPNLPRENFFIKQEPGTETESCMAAMESQKNSGLGLTPGEDVRPLPLQVPCPSGVDNSSVQIAPVDSNQKLIAANTLSPVKNMGFDMGQAGMATATPAGEHDMTEKDKPKKKKCKEQDLFPKREKIQKRLETEESHEKFDDMSLYRPYRCVHEGCVAAFAIQQNLILHYKAMHKSGRSGDEDSSNADKVKGADQVHEFKCQVKECSKVVSKVTSLLKHYLFLHRCTLEKASALLSGVKVGTFQCDQSKCPAYFTCHLKYIDHIKNDHKAIRVSADGDFENVDLTFRCECEGCDRVYTTKSNLLRHLMKKHNANFETIKQRKDEGENVSTKPLGASPNNGKENIASNKGKPKKKTPKKKDVKSRNHWTSFGEPSLKSMEEASAMCTAKFPLQYPCMIVGCDSVSSSERLIFKHYTTHGLAERYIEDQRSQFILCKKYSRLRVKDVIKSGDASSAIASEVEKTEPVESPAENCLTNSQDPKSQDSRPLRSKSQDLKSQKSQDPEPPQAEAVANEKSSAVSGPEAKPRRGRPRKSEQMLKMNPERKRSLRNFGVDENRFAKLSRFTSKTPARREEQAESGVAQKLFSPSGLEASILKLFEESPSKQKKKRKKRKRYWTRLPFKPQQKKQQQLAKDSRKNSAGHEIKGDGNFTLFRNPLNLETVNNVKIIIDEHFSSGADLLLKQLQDMRPMVILKRWLCS